MSTLIDTFIGLVVVFLIFSIIVSGINEWFAQACGRRGHYLRIGLQRLINDDAIFRRVFNHPLVNAFYRDASAKGKPPSYIEPGNFALAISDVLHTRAMSTNTVPDTSRPMSFAGLRYSVSDTRLAGLPIREALLPLIDNAGGDLKLAMSNIEDWYVAGMDRMGGWYKARTQKMLFLIGFVLAMAVNVDALELYATLNRSPSIRAALVQAAETIQAQGKVGDVRIAELKETPPSQEQWKSLLPVIQAFGKDNALPIGYGCLGALQFLPDETANALQVSDPAKGAWVSCKAELHQMLHRPLSGWFLKVVGWAITALAGTLGATYWFQLLSKVINLRGSGSKPVKQREPF